MYVRNAHGDYTMPDVEIGNCYCCVEGCSKRATDRAHVRICDQFGNILDRTVYIVPMCAEHNRSRTNSPLKISNYIQLKKIN